MKTLLILASLLVLSASSALAAKAPKAFTKMDANSDGQIDTQEWLASNKERTEKTGKEFDESKVLKNMKRKDTDGDGMISVEEFAAAMKPKDSGDKAKKMKKD